MNANEYDRMNSLESKGWWFVAKRRFVLTALQQFASTAPVHPLLDAGCGTGATLECVESVFGLADLKTGIAGEDVQNYGLDPSQTALHFARQKCESHLVCGSAEQIPFCSESFQLALMLDVLEHLDDDLRALKEVNRVLAPGGHLALTTPAFPFLWSDHDIALHHRRRYTRRGLLKQLKRGGFEPIFNTYLYKLLFPIAAVERLWRRVHPHRPPTADLGIVPDFLNTSLIALMEVEARLLLRAPIPFGSSILVLARKPV